MAKYYAPNFSGLLPLFDGKSAAGGKLYAYRAGSSIPAPLFNADGVELGSWVSIDSNGCADFLLDSSLSYKLIVKDALGAVVGEWDNVKATNAEGMENPMTAPGDLIVGGTGGTATALPAGNDDQMLSPYTVDGVKKLGWKNIPAQPGDHKVMVDGADGSPGYLLDKLADGDNAHFSKSGNAVKLDADNDKVAADNTDTAPGYLLDKLYPGNNVAIEAVTDGDVRKVKISAAGGGGGGDFSAQPFGPPNNSEPKIDRRVAFVLRVFGGTLPSVVKSFSFFLTGETPAGLTNFRAVVAIYQSGNLVSPFTWANHATFSTRNSSGVYQTINYDSPVSIDPLKNYDIYFWYNQDNYTNIRFFISRTYGTPVYGGPRRITMSSDPGDHYGAVPAQSSSITGSSVYTEYMPWIALNSFAGQED